MSLGVAIGAITFTGSVIAFLKLSGRMSGAPITLPARHAINIALAIAIVVLVFWFVRAESYAAFWLLVLAAFLYFRTLDAGGGRSWEGTGGPCLPLTSGSAF